MGRTPSDDEWDWEFSPRAETQFSQLDANLQQRIIDKLDDVVSSEWRDPDEFLESLTTPRSTNFVSEITASAVGWSASRSSFESRAFGSGTERTKATTDDLSRLGIR